MFSLSLRRPLLCGRFGFKATGQHNLLSCTPDLNRYLDSYTTKALPFLPLDRRLSAALSRLPLCLGEELKKNPAIALFQPMQPKKEISHSRC